MGNIDAHTHDPWVILPLKAVKQSNSRLKPLLSPTFVANRTRGADINYVGGCGGYAWARI